MPHHIAVSPHVNAGIDVSGKICVECREAVTKFRVVPIFDTDIIHAFSRRPNGHETTLLVEYTSTRKHSMTMIWQARKGIATVVVPLTKLDAQMTFFCFSRDDSTHSRRKEREIFREAHIVVMKRYTVYSMISYPTGFPSYACIFICCFLLPWTSQQRFAVFLFVERPFTNFMYNGITCSPSFLLCYLHEPQQKGSSFAVSLTLTLSDHGPVRSKHPLLIQKATQLTTVFLLRRLISGSK